MVPNGWSRAGIGDLASFSSGGTPSKQASEFWGGGEPWISGKDLKQHYLSNSKDTLTACGFEVAKRTAAGTTLVLVRGMALLKDFPLGYATREVAFNQDIKALAPNNEIDGLYLSFALVGNRHKLMALVTLAGHGTGRIDTERLKSFPVLVPPLPEQRKIAKILQTWGRAIDTTEKLIDASKQQKKALMQQLLTGKKRFAGFEGRGEWKTMSLGDICSGNLEKGPFGSQLHAHEYVKAGVSVLMPKDLKNCRADTASAAKIPAETAEKLSKHKLENGDLIFSRRGDVSRFALIDKNSEGCICGTGCLKAVPNQAHSSSFLSYFLQKNSVRKWLEHNSVGQTMPNMNTAILAELPLAAASSKAEEDKIAVTLGSTDEQINVLKVKLNHLKQEKKALMQQLLTGKRRVKVDE